METSRRDTLRIIGALGATSTLPVLGQDHNHPAEAPARSGGPYKPVALSAAEFALTAKLADLIIPPTDTPGAAAAGVADYIDTTLSKSPSLLASFREGLALLGPQFLQLTEQQQIDRLTPWSDACDRRDYSTAGAKFFRSAKSLTIDGYYGSYEGLVTELGYHGNTALASFPGCTEDHTHAK